MSPRPRRFVLSTLAALSLLGPALFAQEPSGDESPIAVGSRVRVLAPTVLSGRIEGRVLEISDRTLVIDVHDRIPLRVPREAMTRVEVSVGGKRQPLRGLLWGAASGAVLFGVTSHSEKYCSPADPYCFRSRGEAVGVGAAGGAIWGLAIGALIKSDDWRQVPASRLRLNVGPARHGGVAASISF